MLESVRFMKELELAARDKILALRESIGLTIKGKRETIDLAIIDYLMPGMDGLDLVDMLRAMPESAHVPILFMSARPPWPELKQRQLECLEKPFELDLFAHQIKELLA